MADNIYSALKKVQVDKLYRRVRPFLPDKVTDWVNKLRKRHDETPLVTVDQLKPQYEEACAYLSKKRGKDSLGDYLEFGVCHGTSMSLMHDVLTEKGLDNIRLFGFDSFEGLPEYAADEEYSVWEPGDFACSLRRATENLTNHGVDWDRTELIKGWYQDTLHEETAKTYHITKASLIMIDCDLYSAAAATLDFCAPLIKDESIIFFDDWTEDKESGEEHAWNEFLKNNDHFQANLFGSYEHQGVPTGKVFSVVNTSAERFV